MLLFLRSKIVWTLAALTVAVAAYAYLARTKKVDYSADVKPILNKHCISCHGGVKKQGGFGLLFRTDALAVTESGKPAIIPGYPDSSEMIRRLTLKDPEERMPYKHEPLSDEDIATLRNWIKQGAQWGEHWAYTTVRPVEVPKEGGFFRWLRKNDNWPLNDIDHFILQKIKEQGLRPASRASRPDLLRRVSLDLIGMPANDALATRFLNNNAVTAYEDLVDSLLASPHFGERWASLWMDLARYADTKGYERDDSRNIWRYRDWLIQSFNEDKPYDQFLTEQIAGDLLPDATDEQIIATAFHRNTMTNDEGGTDNEEFRTAAVMDRVNTTWEGLMGTTFACVQCHSHPYDPFRHEDYYKFMAFFNNSRDEDTQADYPVLRHFDDTLQTELQELANWLQQHSTPERAKAWLRFVKTWQPSINSLTADRFVNSELSDTKWLVMRNHSSARLAAVDLSGKTDLFFTCLSFVNRGSMQIHADAPDGPVIARLTTTPAHKRSWGDWAFVQLPLLQTLSGKHDLYITYNSPQLKNENESGLLFDWFHFTEAFPGASEKGYTAVKQLFWKLLTAKVPATPVMIENPAAMRRGSFVFERGNWLVKGEEVVAGTPASLHPFLGKENNRLGLARWLTDKRNPLVARTIVNRLWEQLFGTGLVETLEDLGSQGSLPTHRELLDHLSWRLMHDFDWSLKKLLKEIVLSATYQQDSKLTPQLAQKDAANKWYARGPRVRLSAEQMRDQALVISGLLNQKICGPSVMPWQPDGIWLSPWNGQYWKNSEGKEQYRRAVYTYWKRTAPYPSMISFDGAAREVCAARRIRTNTPLQALTTLNDSAYLDMARHFALRMKQNGSDVQQWMSRGYELATYKKITPQKSAALLQLYNTALQTFKKDEQQVCSLVGQMSEATTAETAALITVANALLNLDEVVTKN